MASYTFENIVDYNMASAVLPSGYTKLEYIENNGNANTYIDTNYIPNQTTSLKVILSSTRKNVSNGMGYIGTYRWGIATTPTGLAFIANTSYWNFAFSYNINEKLNINIDAPQKIFYVNGNSIGTIGTQNFPIGGTYWIGRYNNYNGEYFNGKIYYHEFFENGISVQRLIPCSNPNGEIGMYDVITNTYFPNMGSVPFISGGEATTYSFQNGDIITITNEKNVYKYNNGELIFYYHIAEPLVFKGMTFEQTDLWQRPEFVFRGFTFEEITKAGGMSPLFLAEP